MPGGAEGRSGSIDRPCVFPFSPLQPTPRGWLKPRPRRAGNASNGGGPGSLNRKSSGPSQVPEDQATALAGGAAGGGRSGRSQTAPPMAAATTAARAAARTIRADRPELCRPSDFLSSRSKGGQSCSSCRCASRSSARTSSPSPGERLPQVPLAALVVHARGAQRDAHDGGRLVDRQVLVEDQLQHLPLPRGEPAQQRQQLRIARCLSRRRRFRLEPLHPRQEEPAQQPPPLGFLRRPPDDAEEPGLEAGPPVEPCLSREDLQVARLQDFLRLDAIVPAARQGPAEALRVEVRQLFLQGGGVLHSAPLTFSWDEWRGGGAHMTGARCHMEPGSLPLIAEGQLQGFAGRGQNACREGDPWSTS